MNRHADVHVRIGRLVVDRSALAGDGVRGLSDAVTRRIAHRLEGAAVNVEGVPGDRPDLSDTIAKAVADRVSSQLGRTRRR